MASKGCRHSGFVRIVDPAGSDDVSSFLLSTVWHKWSVPACVSLLLLLTWRVDDLCDSFLASAFAEQDASGRGMSKHVAADGFASVGTREQSAGTRIGLNLVDDQDSDVELLCHLTELAEVLAQLALTFIQLSTAMVVVAEVCHDAVDDEKTVLPGREWLGQTTELVVLVFAILRTDVEDVLIGGLVVNCALSACGTVSWAEWILTAKTLRDLLDTIRTPSSFRVNDSNPTFRATLLFRQLSDDGHGVGKLGLAASYRQSVKHWAERSVHLRNSPYTSLMLADWKPSLRMESHCLLLVEMRKHRFLSCARSALVMKPAPLG